MTKVMILWKNMQMRESIISSTVFWSTVPWFSLNMDVLCNIVFQKWADAVYAVLKTVYYYFYKVP